MEDRQGPTDRLAAPESPVGTQLVAQKAQSEEEKSPEPRKSRQA